MNAPKKRKNGSGHSNPCKRVKLTTATSSSQPVNATTSTETTSGEQSAMTDANLAQASSLGNDTTTAQVPQVGARAPKKRKINKLVPPRPYPTVPTSVSATGPRSAHKEGKNFICLTRKTALGGYMRRCKDIILKDGYKTLHFSAMGAAIPLLLQLVAALPPILPFSADEIHAEVTTGTVEVQDEVIPDDEDEDLTYETRGKSTLKVVFKIGDGEFDGDKSGPLKKNGRHRTGNAVRGNQGSSRAQQKAPSKESKDIVLQEPEQEEMEML